MGGRWSRGLLLAFFLLIAHTLPAQHLKYYSSHIGAKVVINGDSLFSPWSEGLLNPQFSEIDLNNDGVMDLCAFEPFDGRMVPFLYAEYGLYYYAPQYASAFPEMDAFALLRDYNGDGKADIFTLSKEQGGFDIYENISVGDQLAFRLVKRTLLYKAPGGFDVNVYVPSSDVPAVVDLDGDGDLDILAFDVFQSRVQYFKNVSMEKYGHADSLEYVLETDAWGKFELSPFNNSIQLGLQKKHGGSSLFVSDLDGDGDADVLIGDVGYPNLLKIENGKIRNGEPPWPRDSMIAVDSFWPSLSEQASIDYFPAAYEIDIDHDGLKDIIVVPHQADGSQLTDMVYYYHQEGTASKPIYRLRSRNWLLSEMVDYGLHMAPALADLNGDGLPDLMMAAQANKGTYYDADKLILLLNKGTKDRAVFVETNFQGDLQKQTYARPCLGDLDGDGLPDMLVGNAKGELQYYHNDGLSNGVPQMKWITSSYQGISASSYSAPYLSDLDGDGLLDLLLGKFDGFISYFRNTGSKTNATFTLITDHLSSIRTNKPFYRYITNQDGQIIDSTLTVENMGASAPVVADFDGDGKPDVLCGSLHNGLTLYLNVGEHIMDSVAPISHIWYNDQSTSPDSINPGSLLIPTAADMNGDNIPDIIVGNYRGGGSIFLSKPDPLGIEKPQSTAKITLFPNPTQSTLHITLPISWPNRVEQVTIYNLSGKKQLQAKALNLDVTTLPSGIYFIIVQCENSRQANGWFIKLGE